MFSGIELDRMRCPEPTLPRARCGGVEKLVLSTCEVGRRGDGMRSACQSWLDSQVWLISVTNITSAGACVSLHVSSSALIGPIHTSYGVMPWGLFSSGLEPEPIRGYVASGECCVPETTII